MWVYDIAMQIKTFYGYELYNHYHMLTFECDVMNYDIAIIAHKIN